MLQASTVVTDAIAPGTGPRTAESETLLSHSPTEAVSLIRAAPHLLSPDQEDSMMGHPNISGNDAPFDEFIEVINDYEHESLTGSAVLQVKGSLRRNISFWHDIGAPEFILSIIQDGYRLPFETIPSGNVLNNNMSSLHYPKFVEEAILELLHTYRVVEVQAPPYVVNPLSVSVQPNGKKRLILDLRYVNKHLIKQRVKYEDWKIALSYFQKGAFMISFDLKSGYHHIDICPDHQTFLGFAWKFSGDTKFRYFVFTVLPFGLASAPFIFTKCLKPHEKYWRIHGISVAIFLDDGWLIATRTVSKNRLHHQRPPT